MEQTSSFWVVVKLWLAPFLWMGIIFWFSAQSTLPSPDDPLVNVLLKKAGHIIVYAVLYGLWFQAWKTKVPIKLAISLSAILSLVYAIFDEWHQSWVPLRHPTETDILIDTAGILLSMVYFNRKTITRESEEISP